MLKKIWDKLTKKNNKFPSNRFRRIIWWTDNEEGNMRYACVHLVITYCQGYISDYQAMLQEMKKIVPQADETNVNCGSITESRDMYGGTLLRFQGMIPKDRDYSDCKQHKPGSKIDYCFT